VITDYALPANAVPYLLLQRMSTQKFRKLRYYLPFGRTIYNAIYNKYLYQLEAKLREENIKEQYLDEIKREFHCIREYLPDDTTSVLDVGCGVGGMNLFLSDYYEKQQPIFYLFDKTEISDSIYYQFHDKAAFYNSLDVAAESLRQNGVNDKNLHTLDADEFDLSELKQVDLCLSMISWAFHYPLETYLDEVLNCLSEDGSLLLDFRNDTDQLDKARRHFEEDELIESTEKYDRVILHKPHREAIKTDSEAPRETVAT